VLATLVLNKLKGVLQVCAVKAPATATAARPCSKTSPCSPAQGHLQDLGVQLDAITTDAKGNQVPAVVTDKSLGRAKRVKVDAEKHDHHRGEGRQEGGRGPVRADPQGDRADRQRYDREKLQERLAKLAGGVAGHQGRRRD